jgi:hypothetical protein
MCEQQLPNKPMILWAWSFISLCKQEPALSPFPPTQASRSENSYCRLILEFGIVGSHQIWRLRFRSVRKEAKAAGISIEEALERRRAALEGGCGSTEDTSSAATGSAREPTPAEKTPGSNEER